MVDNLRRHNAIVETQKQNINLQITEQGYGYELIKNKQKQTFKRKSSILCLERSKG